MNINVLAVEKRFPIAILENLNCSPASNEKLTNVYPRFSSKRKGFRSIETAKHFLKLPFLYMKGSSIYCLKNIRFIFYFRAFQPLATKGIFIPARLIKWIPSFSAVMCPTTDKFGFAFIFG